MAIFIATHLKKVHDEVITAYHLKIARLFVFPISRDKFSRTDENANNIHLSKNEFYKHKHLKKTFYLQQFLLCFNSPVQVFPACDFNKFYHLLWCCWKSIWFAVSLQSKVESSLVLFLKYGRKIEIKIQDNQIDQMLCENFILSWK